MIYRTLRHIYVLGQKGALAIKSMKNDPQQHVYWYTWHILAAMHRV